MTVKIGDVFTTRVSGITGTVLEIHERSNGRSVLLLDVDGEQRYTTV